MGSPLGPGGTLRHGLLAYWTARMMIRLMGKPTRGIKSCETEVNNRQGMARSVAQSSGAIESTGILSRVIVV
jgi:hypothetical protein